MTLVTVITASYGHTAVQLTIPFLCTIPFTRYSTRRTVNYSSESESVCMYVWVFTVSVHQKCSLFSDLSNRCSGHVKLQLFRSPALASGSVSNHTPWDMALPPVLPGHSKKQQDRRLSVYASQWAPFASCPSSCLWQDKHVHYYMTFYYYIKFADDTKLVGTVSSEVELEQLRTDLISDWQVGKCYLTRISV